jgi:NitT/TauT family transport system substrate-binding protein
MFGIVKQSGCLLMEKNIKIAILAIVVVAIVVIGTFALMMPGKSEGDKIVYYTKIAPNLQKQAISNGTVAGGVSWEPYVSDSVVDQSAKVLVWSGDIWPNHPCCVIAVRSDFAQNNPELVERVLKADMVANMWLLDTLSHPGTENYTKLLSLGSTFSARSGAVVENATGHIVFTTELTTQVKEDLAFFVDEFVKLNIVTNETIHSKGYANSTEFVNAIVDTSYLVAASGVQPSSTIIGEVKLGYLAGDLHQFARVVAMNTDLWNGQTLFEKYGVDVTTPSEPGFANGAIEMDAFAAGAIDMGYLGAPPVLQKSLNAGTDVKIVALVNEEGSALVVGNNINSFADLNNKTIATPGEGSIQHLILLSYAEEQGYKVKLAGT